MNALGSQQIAQVGVILATLLATAGALPQLRRVNRTGDTSGVSLAMITLNIASEVGWFIHLSGRGSWAAVPTCVVIVIVYGALLATLVNAGARSSSALVAGALWVGCLSGSWVAIGPAALAALLAVTKVIQSVPPVWTAWRTRRPSGISTATWCAAVVEGLLWALYGVTRHDPALVTLGATGTVAGLAVLARVTSDGTRRSRSGRQPQVVVSGTRESPAKASAGPFPASVLARAGTR